MLQQRDEITIRSNRIMIWSGLPRNAHGTTSCRCAGSLAAARPARNQKIVHVSIVLEACFQ